MKNSLDIVLKLLKKYGFDSKNLMSNGSYDDLLNYLSTWEGDKQKCKFIFRMKTFNDLLKDKDKLKYYVYSSLAALDYSYKDISFLAKIMDGVDNVTGLLKFFMDSNLDKSECKKIIEDCTCLKYKGRVELYKEDELYKPFNIFYKKSEQHLDTNNKVSNMEIF